MATNPEANQNNDAANATSENNQPQQNQTQEQTNNSNNANNANNATNANANNADNANNNNSNNSNNSNNNENTTQTTETTERVFPDTPLGRLQQGFFRLNMRQRITLGAALVMILVLLFGTFLYTKSPEWHVLYANLDERDAGLITEELTKQNIPYVVAENGGILVKEDVVHNTRLKLAVQGLPRGGHAGFELMENQKFGISQFAEQVNYQRALEGELSRTISSITSVEKARVHLAIPKPSVFIREDQKPTASVMVKLYPGRILDGTQIAGITHLISSSVPNMPNENVTIVDDKGAIIQDVSKERLQNGGLDPAQLSYVQDIENNIVQRIENILNPVFGPGNFKVQASADIDFSHSESTAEVFHPNTKPEDSAIRSQQTSESTGVNIPLAGVPGALTNQPPVPATAPITDPQVPGPGAQQRKDSGERGRIVNAGIDAPLDTLGQPIGANKTATINYEVDKTISHTKHARGEIRRLTAAVVVNYRKVIDEEGNEKSVALKDDEIKKIESLVRDAMGYNAKRGDSVAVVNSEFTEIKDEMPIWKDPQSVAVGLDILKYLIIAGIIALLYFKIIKPALDTMFPPPPAPVSEDEKAEDGTANPEEDDMEMEEVEEIEYDEAGNIISRRMIRRQRKKGLEEEEHEETKEERAERLAREAAANPYNEKLRKARDIAVSDPKAVAGVVKTWMGIDSGGN